MTTAAADKTPLAFAIRGDLFHQLAALEDAGVPFDRALGALRAPPAARDRLAQMRRQIALGVPIAEAGRASGLFTPLEAALVQAAASAGSPARTYRSIAGHCVRQAARVKRMKSRMLLPAAIVVVAAITQPLPMLIAGEIGAIGYLFRCLLPLALIAVGARLFTELPRHLSADSPAMRDLPIDGLLPQLPLFGPIYERRSVRDFCESLGLMLEAGMPILQALPQAVQTMHSVDLRAQFARIAPHIEGGGSLATAFVGQSFPGKAVAQALVVAGEGSGQLPAMLTRYADAETAAIEAFDNAVAQWVPRIVYWLVALYIAYGIVRGGGFMPQLPPDAR